NSITGIFDAVWRHSGGVHLNGEPIACIAFLGTREKGAIHSEKKWQLVRCELLLFLHQGPPFRRCPGPPSFLPPRRGRTFLNGKRPRRRGPGTEATNLGGRSTSGGKRGALPEIRNQPGSFPVIPCAAALACSKACSPVSISGRGQRLSRHPCLRHAL